MHRCACMCTDTTYRQILFDITNIMIFSFYTIAQLIMWISNLFHFYTHKICIAYIYLKLCNIFTFFHFFVWAVRQSHSTNWCAHVFKSVGCFKLHFLLTPYLPSLFLNKFWILLGNIVFLVLNITCVVLNCTKFMNFITCGFKKGLFVCSQSQTLCPYCSFWHRAYFL